ncbi:LysR substrate-binding domain-containing protein, partial [Acinetobacter baumannii]
FPYVDRLRCEFRDRIQEHFARQEIVMRPRFRAERDDWVHRVVADGHAICILPEHSGPVPGLVTRPIEGLSLERELVIVTVSGSTTPREMRKI